MSDTPTPVVNDAGAPGDPLPDPNAAPSPASSAASGGPVQVTFPSGPTNSRQSGPLQVNNTNNDSGSVFINNDLVSFEIANDSGDNVTCAFELDDDQQPGVVLAVGSLTWDAGDTSTKYIQFQGFPLRADQEMKMDRCDYKMTLTNNVSASTGVEVWENIY